MIIGRATTEGGGEALILGLSRGNVQRLTAGQPMKISRETHGDGIPEGWAILIAFGETEEDLIRDLGQAIGPDTKIHRDARL